MASSITSSIQNYGEINTGLKDMQTNLVPYKKMHFLVPSHSPFTKIDQNGYKDIEIHELSDPLFEGRNQMASCDPRLGKYLACSLAYRGDLVPKDIVSYLSTLK
jgi:tubulin alpha